MEVFKKALERIADSRYGKTVFQLVAAARRPLALAELRISLHIKPGIPDWSLLDLPQDARAIITLCGGGLLEIDEETDTVHFIHHSVYQYLTGGHPGTSDYQFSLAAADIALGMRCVTYLAYSIFDTALTTSPKQVVVDTAQLTEQMKQLAKREVGLASTIVTAIRRRPMSSWNDANIGRTIQRVLESKVEAAELLAFSDYAHELVMAYDTPLSSKQHRSANATPSHCSRHSLPYKAPVSQGSCGRLGEMGWETSERGHFYSPSSCHARAHCAPERSSNLRLC